MKRKQDRRWERCGFQKNYFKRTSDIEWNLQKVIEEEERDIEMQSKSKERRMSIA